MGVFSNRSPRILITCPALAKDILTKHFRSFHDNEFGEFTESAGDAESVLSERGQVEGETSGDHASVHDVEGRVFFSRLSGSIGW